MTVRLFVYGTLMPGLEAWPVVEVYAEHHEPTTVRGRLFDTGAGYPAAVFALGDTAEGGGSVIAGTAVTLHAVRADRALARLDRYEGRDYRRIVVHDDHGALFAYEWIGGHERLVELPSGSWTASS